MNLRVIPRLDIKGPNLVKGIHLEGLRVLGRPQAFARHYYEHGADELVYMDAVASLYGRNSLLDLVRETSRSIFIPLTVGGGIRGPDDVREVLRAGADKVAINTAAVRDPQVIRTCANRFGSSTIVASIEAIRQPDGRYENFTENGREETGLEVVPWARRLEELGAGEIFLTSVDREGTGKGFDAELVRSVADAVSIPVIACGGAGSPQHVVEVVRDGHADAVSLATMLHYQALEHLGAEVDASEGNREFLSRGPGGSRRPRHTLAEVKAALREHGVDCRAEVAA